MDDNLFRRVNHTEAYQLCRQAGIPCTPSDTRDTLVRYLLADNPTPTRNPIDSWRHGIAGFVLDHWNMLQPQITCPIKSKDPRACFGCLDTQVMECIVRNPDNEGNIKNHKKDEP